MKTGDYMKKIFIIMGLLMYALSTQQSLAAPGGKPFAEEKIVLQISDADPEKQTLILNVSSNLIKYYGPDKVDIEIVAFGPGLRLLFKNNSNSERIDGLDENGVRFAACQNTLDKMTSLLGEKPALNSKASSVPAGVVRIVELQNQGYKLIKP